ncbi:hypothetical protein MC885_000205 [Smutsia gigantea]|nr:hypothetical protein MC885_000205 [Smutsia gigantea]
MLRIHALPPASQVAQSVTTSALLGLTAAPLNSLFDFAGIMEQNGMEIPVILIIKAPNQKYSEQTISCFLNWTVGKLKTHLSNMYPSKPGARGDGGSSRNRRTGPFGKKTKAQEVGSQPADRPQEAPWTDFCDFQDITHELTLPSRAAALSLVSLVDGYFHLAADSSHYLCHEVAPPGLVMSFQDGIHGPLLLKTSTNGESPSPAWRPLFAEHHREGTYRSENVCSVQALIADFRGTPTFIYKAHIFFTDSE